MKFVDRNWELEFLEKKYRENKTQLVVIYGKRRVGKTELIKQFSKGKPHIYFLADKTSEHDQLKDLSQKVASFFKDSFLKERGFENWLQVFSYLKEKGDPLIFTVDEFPYLVDANRAISSVFQKGWDEYLKDFNVFLILSGSSVSMMESEVLGYKAPLYGRRTGQILVEPLKFQDIRGFFPHKSLDELVEIYASLGGIPAYLLQFNPEKSLWDNVKSKVLSKGEILYDEPEFILREELREPRNYFSILKAISLGKTKLGEIINETGFEKSMANKYLSVLADLRIIRREVPVTEKNPAKSKKGIYLIEEPFMRFWFAFVLPGKSYIEVGQEQEVLRRIKRNFSVFVSFAYKRVAKEILEKPPRDFSLRFTKVGRYWDRQEEIDVVAINEEEKEALFAEVRWQKNPMDLSVLRELIRKAEVVEWEKGQRKEHFALFSRSGFTDKLKREAKKQGVFLFCGDKLE